MTHIFRLMIFAVVLISLLPAAASVRADSLNAELHTHHFIVRYDSSGRGLADVTAEMAEDQLLRVSKSLGYDLEQSRPFSLCVYSTHYAFLQAGGSRLGEFTVGMARSSDQSISVDASSSFVSVREVLAHEITHAIVFRELGNVASEAPLWFHEGLAKYESEKYDDADRQLLANAAANSGFIPLSRLESSFPDDATALAYAESASAVRLLVKLHGKSAPHRVLEALKDTGSFDEAMRRVSGENADDFADTWMREMSHRYGLLKISQVVSAVIGIIMAILAIVAFFVRRKQKMEAIKRWEAEEFEEALRRQMGNDWWR